MIKYLLLIIVLIFYLVFTIELKHKGILSQAGIDTSLNSYLPFLILVIICFFAYLLFSRKRQLETLNGNLAIIAKLLGAEIKRPFLGLWFYRTIEGYYRNRKIVLKISLAAGEHDVFWRWMKLGGNYAVFRTLILDSNKNNLLFFSKFITQDIFLKRNWLYYRGKFSNMIVHKDYSEEEIVSILNELINHTDRLVKR